MSLRKKSCQLRPRTQAAVPSCRMNPGVAAVVLVFSIRSSDRDAFFPWTSGLSCSRGRWVASVRKTWFIIDRDKECGEKGKSFSLGLGGIFIPETGDHSKTPWKLERLQTYFCFLIRESLKASLRFEGKKPNWTRFYSSFPSCSVISFSLSSLCVFEHLAPQSNYHTMDFLVSFKEN